MNVYGCVTSYLRVMQTSYYKKVVSLTIGSLYPPDKNVLVSVAYLTSARQQKEKSLMFPDIESRKCSGWKSFYWGTLTSYIRKTLYTQPIYVERWRKWPEDSYVQCCFVLTAAGSDPLRDGWVSYTQDHLMKRKLLLHSAASYWARGM
jgi:hypothetical protein